MSIQRLLLVFGLVTITALPVAAEELTIIGRETATGGQGFTVVQYIGANRIALAKYKDAIGTAVNQGDVKFYSSSDLEDMYVFEPANGTITFVDAKKKEYWTMTKQEMEAAAAKMQAQMKQMEEQMKNMPAGLREKMAGMMGGVAAAVNVQRGQGGRKVAGYSCENWTVTIGEMVKQEQCMTTELQLPVQAWDAYKGFAGSMSGPMGQGMQQMYEKFKEMKGVPLASTTTVKVLGKAQTSSSEVVEIKKGPIPPSAWTIPPGYKKVESPMAKMAK